MYAAVLFIGVQNAMSVQPVVDIERTVFYRERAAGMYSALPYAFAQVNWFRYSTLLSFWEGTGSFINALSICLKSWYTNTGHKHENMCHQNSEHWILR